MSISLSRGNPKHKTHFLSESSPIQRQYQKIPNSPVDLDLLQKQSKSPATKQLS
ncbi:hypothetical protein Fmac_008336 [Flemingia macrophylla]|uniref:Uncharacterized protein n=1 Tax=Flemingia macrophylla TaxID=520843 RepID=A0ABD1MXM9_9FABA